MHLAFLAVVLFSVQVCCSCPSPCLSLSGRGRAGSAAVVPSIPKNGRYSDLATVDAFGLCRRHAGLGRRGPGYWFPREAIGYLLDRLRCSWRGIDLERVASVMATLVVGAQFFRQTLLSD